MNQFRPITMILLNTNYLHEYEKDKSFQKEGGGGGKRKMYLSKDIFSH